LLIKMPSIVTTAHLQTKSKAARDELIKVFHEITEYSRANEPEVLRYITCIPADVSNETSLYMIEEYASQAVSDAHLASQPVQKLLKYFETEQPLTGAPEVFNLNPAIDFQRSITSAPELIILAHFEYKPGKSTNALKGWKDFVSYCEKNEPPVLGYTVMQDEKNSTLRTVELYDNATFVSEVHVGSEAVKANQEQNGADRTGQKGQAKLKVVQGFFGR